MTACPSAPTAGLSWGGMLCSRQLSKSADGLWISGAGVSSLDGRDEAQVVAHELVHGLGMEDGILGGSHNCRKGCDCTGDDCLNCCPCNDQPKFDFEKISSMAYQYARPLVMLDSHVTSFSDCDCKDYFLMSPSTSMLSTQASLCTKREVCNSVAAFGTCLVGKN